MQQLSYLPFLEVIAIENIHCAVSTVERLIQLQIMSRAVQNKNYGSDKSLADFSETDPGKGSQF